MIEGVQSVFIGSWCYTIPKVD